MTRRKPARKKNSKKPGKKKAASKRTVRKTQKKSQRKVSRPVVTPKVPEQRPKIVKYPVVEWADSDSIKMLLPLLREMMRKKIITDWSIDLCHARSANVYVGQDFSIEDELCAIREDVGVTVYKRFPDGKVGEAEIPIITSNPSIASKQLLDAASICSHTKKPGYDIPEPAEGITFPLSFDEQVLDAFRADEGMRISRALYDQIREILQPQDVLTNCFEVFSNASAHRIVNSRGIDISYHKTSIYVEITLSASADGEEQEFQWRTTVVSPDQLDLRSALERQVEISRDAVRAAPNPGFTGDILLFDQSLLDFCTPDMGHNPLVLHTSAKLKLMGISQLKKDQPLGEFLGEPFTITSDPQLPLGLLTAPVDDEGTPWKPVDLIRTGVFLNYITTSRYAQPMGLPLTGNVSNIHIGHGATREEHLRGHNYFEIVSFSWFNPDPFSGDFSAEVRLGYHWLRGRRTPFKGGHFRGNVFKNLLHARFSKEAMQSGRYYGPRVMLFKNATVTQRS